MPQIIMPKMGDGMEEGTLLKWLKSEGDEVEVGDAIAEIETDKVSLEIEATEGGTLSRLLVGEGDVVPIGQPIAQIGDDGGAAPAAPAEETVIATAESAPAQQPAASASAAQPGPAATAPAPGGTPPAGEAPRETAPAQSQPTTGANGHLRASPLVKRLAAEHGIDLRAVQGSGPGGRIVKDDVMPYVTGAKQAPVAAPAPATQPAAESPAGQTAQAAPGSESAGPATYAGRPAPVRRDLARIRRVTGRRMAESKQTVPHFYVTAEVAMDAAAAFRAELNSQVPEGGARVSFNDLIVKAAALALRRHPDLNASFEGGELYDHPNIDINVAVALDGGLIAPFIPDADQKSLGAIARASSDLINRAKNGGLTPEEYQGGTFTISNLGMLDVDEFIAVINPPQAAILAVGAITRVPVVIDGEITVGSRMKLSVSADHRSVDGAEVARFLQTVRGYLEKPMTLALG